MPEIRPIGEIRTPFATAEGTPIQGRWAEEHEGEVVVEEAYAAALDDIEGFERIWLVYRFDRAGPFRPRVVPFRDTVERGLFSTRAPSRPNPIGLTVVRLLGRKGARLRVAGVDMLDRTPLIDVKPYVPAFDAFPDSAAGWLDLPGSGATRADDRFLAEE